MNFALPRPLDFDADEQADIIEMVTSLYDDGITARTRMNDDHEMYEQMFRGNLPQRDGPWDGSANLHVQCPYWLVDTISVRTTSTIFNNVPLVSCHYDDPKDAEKARQSAQLVEWHMSQKRMDLRPTYHRLNKLRCIHGVSVGLMSYVTDSMKVRLEQDMPDAIPVTYKTNPDGTLAEDSDGNPIPQAPEPKVVDQEYYRGPVLTPLDFDDVVVPLGAMNLQPNRPSNPKGADWVILRQWERLSLMFKKAQQGRGGVAPYAFMFDDDAREDKSWWIGKQPSQDRRGSGRADNNRMNRNQNRNEGRTDNNNRTQNKINPEFEVLTWFGSYEVDGEEQEVVFFISPKPAVFLGGFILSDYFFRGKRPLPEWHYQTVGTRWYSMGIMEIVKYLSAELDTIHNMRLDVGFATNMPWFAYQASSGFDPDEMILKPNQGIPVDDVNAIRFQTHQNVTSFYYQEEQMLFTLIERVMGISDLFLGTNPRGGAAARHATGYVGAQQEGEARMAEIINQDVRTFAFIAELIYELELQYGPEYRTIRLEGEGRVPTETKMSRQDLIMQGDYDFTLGPNYGTYSQSQRQQQAEIVMGLKGTSQLMNQDPRRIWEAEHFYLTANGIHGADRFIGSSDSVPSSAPKTQEEENGMMDQYYFGPGIPAPVNPNDNDDEHMQQEWEYINSDVYKAMGSPNADAHMEHLKLHQQNKQQKQQMMMQQAQMNRQNGQADPMNRAQAQIGQLDPMMGNTQQQVATDQQVSMPQIPAPPM